MQFNNTYNPITAAPSIHNEFHMEIEPCKELKAYIKCFWGSEKPYEQSKATVKKPSIIIPDTCLDIVINIDHTNNIIRALFCGIDDKAYLVHNSKDKKVVSTFAIRFYPWSAFLFTEDSLINTKNTSVDLEEYFPKLKRLIESQFYDAVNINDRMQLVQKYLLENIHVKRKNCLVMSSCMKIIKHKGNIEIGELSKSQYISNRQLERVFAENIGVTPKKLSSLVRYQFLWRDILYKADFNVLDAVFQYGYVDQAHLSHEFKRYHGMSISEAKRFSSKDVVFLQDDV